MFTLNNDLKEFFESPKTSSEKESFIRRALTKSAGHGCIHTRPVTSVPFYFSDEMTGRIDQIRNLFKRFISELIANHFSLVVKDLWKLEFKYTLDETNRTSLSLRSFRKWLYTTEQPSEKFSLVIAGISALQAAQCDDEFIKLLISHGWNDQNFNEFEDIISRFARAKAMECAQYFFSIMDQQKDHSAARFEEFIGVHQRFVTRIANHRPQFVRNKGEMSTHLAIKAFGAYKEKQIELFTPRPPNAEPLTIEQIQERSHVSFYRGTPMVKHLPQSDSIVISPPFGMGKDICLLAQKSFGRQVAVLDFLPRSQIFVNDGLCHHFVYKPQEAHVTPASKIFSGFGYHFADSLGVGRDVAYKYIGSLMEEFTHKSVFGDDLDRKLGNSIERLSKGKDTAKTKFAKLFMMLEYISLCEASRTNHMPPYYNQKIDHLSESKTKDVDPNVTTDPLALRIVHGVHHLLDYNRAVNPDEVLNAHEVYFQSIKRACRDWLVEQSSKKIEATRTTIREALGLVGAFDHLLAVYRVEQIYLDRISPLEDFGHGDLFRLMQGWVEMEAEKNGIDIL